MFGQEAVLPIEVNLDAFKLANQNDLFAIDYHDLMMDNIDEVTDKHLKALKKNWKDKLRVARAYNKKLKSKSFQVGDLVWKTILPLGMKSNKFWQIVVKLGRSVQDFQGHLWEFIYGGGALRRTSTQGYQWEILEEILHSVWRRA